MAATVATRIQPLSADHTNVGTIVVADITLDASYGVGGYAVVPNSIGFAEVWSVSFSQKAPLDNSYVYAWDFANNKVVVFEQSDADNNVPLSEVEASADLSAVTVRATFYGLKR